VDVGVGVHDRKKKGLPAEDGSIRARSSRQRVCAPEKSQGKKGRRFSPSEDGYPSLLPKSRIWKRGLLFTLTCRGCIREERKLYWGNTKDDESSKLVAKKKKVNVTRRRGGGAFQIILTGKKKVDRRSHE